MKQYPGLFMGGGGCQLIECALVKSENKPEGSLLLRQEMLLKNAGGITTGTGGEGWAEHESRCFHALPGMENSPLRCKHYVDLSLLPSLSPLLTPHAFSSPPPSLCLDQLSVRFSICIVHLNLSQSCFDLEQLYTKRAFGWLLGKAC